MLIVIDGAIDVPEALGESTLVRRVSGEIWMNGERFTGNRTEFWKAVRNGNYPSTTPPTVSDLVGAYEHPGLVLALHVSSQLSATVSRAEVAAARSGSGVVVVDTGALSVGAGLITAAVHRAAASPQTDDSVTDFARSLPSRLHTFALIQDVEALRRSDRDGLLPNTHLLRNRRMVLTVRGRVVPLSQPKHRNGAVEELAAHVRCSAGPDLGAWALGHGDASDVEAIVYDVSKSLRSSPVFVTELDPVVGAHLGPESVVIGAITGPVEL
jgi:DegV family protein with EDD domain